MGWADCGVPGHLAQLRRRVGPGPQAAQGTHLGPLRPYSGGEGDQQPQRARVLLAALIATRPSQQARLIYRTRTGLAHGQDPPCAARARGVCEPGRPGRGEARAPLPNRLT